MPNWCENELTIKGPGVEEIMAFLKIPAKSREELGDEEGEKAYSDAFDFNLLLPYPARYSEMDEEARDLFWDAQTDGDALDLEARQIAYYAKWGTNKDGFNSGGYEWCVRNWGTKWNASWVDREGPNKITFDTAWSPPEGVVAALAAKFPKNTFVHKFWEGGAGFKGRHEYRKGVLYSQSTTNYSGGRGG